MPARLVRWPPAAARRGARRSGESKMPASPAKCRPTEKPLPPSSGNSANTDSSVTSSPMNTGMRPANGGCCHQFAHAVALADVRPLDFEHRLARQHFGRLAGKGRAAGRDMRAQAVFVLRRLAIMQRERIALVLDDDAGARRRRRRRDAGADPAAAARSTGSRRSARRRSSAPWPPIAGSLSGANSAIEIGDRAPAHQRERAAGQPATGAPANRANRRRHALRAATARYRSACRRHRAAARSIWHRVRRKYPWPRRSQWVASP